MELKHEIGKDYEQDGKSLNRTFYGIETDMKKYTKDIIIVLIVPFMELKQVLR